MEASALDSNVVRVRTRSLVLLFIAAAVGLGVALSLLLDHVGETEASRAVEDAVAHLIRSGEIKSMQAGVHSTTELGTMVEQWVLAE